MSRTIAAKFNARIEGRGDGERFVQIGLLPEPQTQIARVLKLDGLEDPTIIEKIDVVGAYGAGFLEGVAGSSDPPGTRKTVKPRIRF